jgi:aspartate/methionine/tyrosine aminotransferase
MTHGLSHRGERLLASPPLPRYIREHFERVDDRWDPAANPGGYISMCIAENKLVWDLLAPKMAECREVPQRVVEYDSMIGSISFREHIARFLERNFVTRTVDPAQLAVLGGLGSVLEMLFYVLGDPGDGVLVPTPSYAGFWADLETRNDLSIVPVHTIAAEDFRLTIDHLDAALAGADRPVKALLYTSPSNPLGTVYSPSEIERVLAWAEDQGLHLVVDEMFALSTYGDVPFVSATSLRPSLGERMHLVWAFSKDFAVSGLRCGVLYSENEALLEAVDGLAYWACVSGDTQYLLGEMISDDAWVNRFVAENRRRLGAAYGRVTTALDAEDIPFVPAAAGFFFLIDVRPFLDEVTWEAEGELWGRLLDVGNVNLTPGAECRVGEPGFMRLCFASQETDAVVAGVERMGRLLGARRSRVDAR